MFKNKKVVIGLVVLVALFIGGIGLGVVKNKANVKSPAIVALSQDTSYDKLLSDVEYQIPKKDIVKEGDKVEAKFNVVAKDLTAEQVKNLAKKFYENTISKQQGLDRVVISVFNKDEATSSFVDGFYADGLTYKVVYDKEYNSVIMNSYSSTPNVEKSVSKVEWSINDIYEVEGMVKVDIAVPSGASAQDVMSQAKGLIDTIQALNPDKKIEVAEANISTSSSQGFEYNTKYADIIATVEKSTIE